VVREKLMHMFNNSINITSMVIFTYNGILVELFSWHDKQQTFQVVWSYLIEYNLHIQLGVKPQREVPHRATEYQVEYLGKNNTCSN
jgi:hypothetical protein